jgi:dGTPase
VFYLENPERLPAEFRGDAPLIERVCDYVSGMTDGYALAEFARLFLPSN